MRWIYGDKKCRFFEGNKEASLVASKEVGLEINAVHMKIMLCNIFWWLYVEQLTILIIIQDSITAEWIFICIVIQARWLWQHYKLSEHIKMQIHSWIENLDKILLRLLNAIDMDIRSPTKSLTPSIILHSDIGLIEYSQKLPIEWNGFNELPKFEQLYLYEQAKDHDNEITSLDK